jgi:hypothetical protein
MDTITQTPLQVAICSFEDKNLTEFKPKRSFYERVQINRIRFWQLVEGKKRPDVDEAHRLADYFGKPLF